MAPLLRRPEEKPGVTPEPDSECRMVVAEPNGGSPRMRSVDSERGKGGWQWQNHALDPSRKTALIYLTRDMLQGETAVADERRRRRR